MNAMHVIHTYWKLFCTFCEKAWNHNFKPLMSQLAFK